MAVKAFAIFLAIVLISVVQAAGCPGSELIKLTPIATNPNVAPCTRDSGFNLIPPSGYPSEAQVTKMCKSSSCRALIDAVKAQNPSNCDLTLLGVTMNIGQLTASFNGNCARLVPRSRTASYPPC